MRWHPTAEFPMSADKIVLALDGMGGDHAPEVVVNGPISRASAIPARPSCCSAIRRG
jgi:hypothetical protein